MPDLFPNIRNSGTRGPKNFEKFFYIEETCCFSNCSWVREEVSFNNCAKNFALEVHLFLAQISKWIKASELCRKKTNMCAGDVKTKIFNSAGKSLSKVEKISVLSPKMIWRIMFWWKILFLSGMDFCTCRFGFWQLGRKVWPNSEKLTHEVRKIKKSENFVVSQNNPLYAYNSVLTTEPKSLHHSLKLFFSNLESVEKKGKTFKKFIQMVLCRRRL